MQIAWIWVYVNAQLFVTPEMPEITANTLFWLVQWERAPKREHVRVL